MGAAPRGASRTRLLGDPDRTAKTKKKARGDPVGDAFSSPMDANVISLPHLSASPFFMGPSYKGEICSLRVRFYFIRFRYICRKIDTNAKKRKTGIQMWTESVQVTSLFSYVGGFMRCVPAHRAKTHIRGPPKHMGSEQKSSRKQGERPQAPASLPRDQNFSTSSLKPAREQKKAP